MLRVTADHPHHPLAVDDLALVTNLFDRRPDFHRTALPRNSNFSALHYSYHSAPAGILGGEFHQNDIPHPKPYKILAGRWRRVGNHLSPASLNLQPIGETRKNLTTTARTGSRSPGIAHNPNVNLKILMAGLTPRDHRW